MYLKKKNDVFLFDLDGVLWDSTRAHHAAFNEALSVTGISVPLSYYATVLSGKTTSDSLAQIKNDFNADFDPNLINLLHSSKQRIARDLLPSCSINEYLVQKILAHPKTSCIVTGASIGTVNVFLSIAKLGFRPYIVSGEDSVKSKPDPEPYTLAMKLFDSHEAPRFSVYEDSENGVLSAFRAGVTRIIVVNDFKADLSKSEI